MGPTVSSWCTNSVVVVLDDEDRVRYQQRLRNELPGVLAAVAPFRETLQGIAVESTYNWYWLVDGLMDAGYVVHLAHVPALPQYRGLKHADDQHDARWLAHLLRLGLLPTGHIYPKADRPLRDLLRKRGQWVRQKTAVVLSLQSLLARLTGQRVSLNRIRQLTPDAVFALVPAPEQGLSVTSSLTVLRCLETQITTVEQAVRAQASPRPGFALLQTVTGIGPTLAATILLEAGDIRRFATVGQFASYCRCVSSQYLSNGKRKGAGNTKNGNKSLSWAFCEAAHFAIRYDPVVRRFYQRKMARTAEFVALKAVAHKLARACYHMLRDQVPFQVTRA
ncbi:MAG: IS110 family transposase, partial [Nitrospirae bacterium]|nr:IS110 family transposase [Nitrospirota bacterium]